LKFAIRPALGSSNLRSKLSGKTGSLEGGRREQGCLTGEYRRPHQDPPDARF
jgi:hypothetical protein